MRIHWYAIEQWNMNFPVSFLDALCNGGEVENLILEKIHLQIFRVLSRKAISELTMDKLTMFWRSLQDLLKVLDIIASKFDMISVLLPEMEV